MRNLEASFAHVPNKHFGSGIKARDFYDIESLWGDAKVT